MTSLLRGNGDGQEEERHTTTDNVMEVVVEVYVCGGSVGCDR